MAQMEVFNPTPEEISKALNVSLTNVKANWPGIKAACDKEGLLKYPSGVIMVLATIATEASSFKPVKEYGGDVYFTRNYENRKDLGNAQKGDGARFCGRGYGQITGRANYTAFAKHSGIDVVSNPAKMLEPDVAARAMVWFCRRAGLDVWAQKADSSTVKAPCPACEGKGRWKVSGKSDPLFRPLQYSDAACRKCCWYKVRRIYNGGLNGWDRFYFCVEALEKLVK